MPRPCNTPGCKNPRYDVFELCGDCLVKDEWPADAKMGVDHKVEGTAAHFDRYVAGDR